MVHVRLELAGQGWDPHLRDEVRADLQSELAREPIDLRADARETPDVSALLATIQIQVTPGEIARIEIRVRDELTDKVVLRELSLAQTPPEARSLEIAVAAEELLQASWAELMLTPRSVVETPEVPTSVESSLRSRLPELELEPEPEPSTRLAPTRPPAEPRGRASESGPVQHVLTGEATALASIHGLAWLGASAAYELWPIDRLGVGVGLGAVGLVPKTVSEGRVTGIAGVGRVDLIGRVITNACCRLDVQGFARGTVLGVRGRPSPGFEGARRRQGVGEFGAGLRPSFRAGPLWLFFRVEASMIAGGLELTANREAIGGYRGFGLGGGLGVSWAFGSSASRQ